MTPTKDNNQLTTLAFSVFFNPGAYCLLLGSGISKPAGIPTGWDIVLHLIRQIAQLHEETSGDDLADWYKKRFGISPNYSELLEQLASTPKERASILQDIIEPSSDDIENSRKVATLAHKAIAKLVEQGTIKYIITTNFDRLLEQALQQRNIIPLVISSEEAAIGATPLVEKRPIIVKLHGDYLDSRIRNTANELSVYSPSLSELVKLLLSQCGLITCGWSGEWDIALKDLLLSSTKRMYPAYYSHLGHDAPQNLIDLSTSSNGRLLPIDNANTLFDNLSEKIESLITLKTKADPLTRLIAIERCKKYNSEEKYRIRLHDLAIDEARKVAPILLEYNLAALRVYNPAQIPTALQYYQTQCDILSGIVIVGSQWGAKLNSVIWRKAVKELSGSLTGSINNSAAYQVPLQKYPMLHLLYCIGIVSIYSKNYFNIAELFTSLEYNEEVSTRVGIESLIPSSILLWDYVRQIPGRERNLTPSSELLYTLHYEPLQFAINSKADYDIAFDHFELLLATYIQYLKINKIKDQWIDTYYGRFAWKMRHAPTHIKQFLEDESMHSEIIDTGLFPSKAKFFEAKDSILSEVSALNWR